MTLDKQALLEAAILTAQEPLSEKVLCRLFEPSLSYDLLNDLMIQLQQRWQDRALSLCHSKLGWRFQVKQEAFAILGRLNPEKPHRYSRAVLETLAIIAYQQPVTRGNIEAIRGVSVSSTVMQTLTERGWIETIGHKDVLGRPALWATTDRFLTDLNLSALTDLPPLAELGQLILPESEEETNKPAVLHTAED